MKNQSKTKSKAYKYILVQDESGLEFIKVAKQLWKSFMAGHITRVKVRA